MGQHELLLFGTIGKAMKPDSKDRPRSVIMAPRGAHSEKPQAAYEAIEKVSPEPRLEMFARAHRDGWYGWGNEV
jgi:N6-adenosine-specific RNA methylase IME4